MLPPLRKTKKKKKKKKKSAEDARTTYPIRALDESAPALRGYAYADVPATNGRRRKVLVKLEARGLFGDKKWHAMEACVSVDDDDDAKGDDADKDKDERRVVEEYCSKGGRQSARAQAIGLKRSRSPYKTLNPKP